MCNTKCVMDRPGFVDDNTTKKWAKKGRPIHLPTDWQHLPNNDLAKAKTRNSLNASQSSSGNFIIQMTCNSYHIWITITMKLAMIALHLWVHYPTIKQQRFNDITNLIHFPNPSTFLLVFFHIYVSKNSVLKHHWIDTNMNLTTVNLLQRYSKISVFPKN